MDALHYSEMKTFLEGGLSSSSAGTQGRKGKLSQAESTLPSRTERRPALQGVHACTEGGRAGGRGAEASR